MGFLGNILGGIFSVILSPLISFIFSLLYSVLIRGPLSLLNWLDHGFQYVSGAQVDKMLFSTSISDGHAQLNFFASDSPLKMFFMIILGVAGSFLALTIGLMMVSSMAKNKGGPFKKLGRVTLSSSIIFAIPLGFLIALSLAGSVLSAISGQHINMSGDNVKVFSQVTTERMDKMSNAPSNAQKSFDTSQPINGMKERDDTDALMSLDKIYSNFSSQDWAVDQSIQQIAQISQSDYKALKDLIVKFDGTNFVLKPELQDKINNVKHVIGSIKPNIKDEVMADSVKDLQDYLQVVLDTNAKFVEDSNNLLSYKGIKPTDPIKQQDELKTYNALQNFQTAFEWIYGRADAQLMQVNVITNLQELMQVTGYLISGDIASPDSGLNSLRQHLTDFEENSLVVSFYQTATGNHDTNWDRSIGDFKNNGFMLLVGCALIVAACVIMMLAILFAITRIFDLGLLFIISPGVVLTSALDDGARMKTWANMVIAKLIGIFGIVISLRLFGTLNTVFRHSLDASSLFDGNTGYMVKLVLTGTFGLGGMLAAYKSSQTLSGIVGAGYGIAEGFQGMQSLRVLQSAGKAALGLGGLAGGALGLRAAGGSGGGGPSIGGSIKSSRGPIGRVADTWKDRTKSITDKATTLTGGQVGTSRSKSDRIDRIKSRKQEKQLNKDSQKSLKENQLKNISSWKDRKGNDRK